MLFISPGIRCFKALYVIFFFFLRMSSDTLILNCGSLIARFVIKLFDRVEIGFVLLFDELLSNSRLHSSHFSLILFIDLLVKIFELLELEIITWEVLNWLFELGFGNFDSVRILDFCLGLGLAELFPKEPLLLSDEL